MDIKELSKLDIKDLKNIDFNAFLKQLQSKPSSLAAIGLAAITFFIIIQIGVKYKTDVKNIRNEISSLEKKQASLKSAQKIKDDYNLFWADAPEHISKDRLIELISNIAIDNNIQIVSLSSVSKSEDHYKKTLKVSLSILAVAQNNYQDILSFVEAIENTAYALRIDKWSINTPGELSMRYRKTGKKVNSIKADLLITAVDLKNE